MADKGNDQLDATRPEPARLTPAMIARIGSLAKTREYVQNTMEDVKETRSGQLSPPHTPGQGR